MNMRKRKPRTIAPRLLDGTCRESIGHGLPPSIKEGLKEIARDENQSLSWVLEKVIIRYFKLDKPDYVNRKQK
jgi:hypothetical protein